MSSGRQVLVIGGGLAGITAALDRAAAGDAVTLLEVRRRLGGAAYSFERGGLEMDNGQHVFLRCCDAYRALLRRIGGERYVTVQPRLEIPVLKPGSEPHMLRRSSLPAPLHLAGALARYPHLTRRQRLGATRAALALMRLTPAEEARDAETLGAWLARHGQAREAVGALWDLIALPTLNVPAADASLALGAFVFRTGLLASPEAGDIGFHTGTLADTIARPAERALRRAGVEVRLGWRAERVTRTGAGFEVSGRGGGADAHGADAMAPDGSSAEEDSAATGRGDGGGIGADAVIVALPHTRAARLLEPLLGAPAAALAELGSSPIVNLHVLYDRRVCEYPFAAGVGSPVQYLFDRSAAAGAPAGSQYLAVSLSGATREMSMSVDALRELYLPALEQLLPRARSARVESFLATREHAATFRATPGVGALRLGPRTSIPGLLLAGTWTATGWPATLESAVLSGHAAAAGVGEWLGDQRRGATGASAGGPVVAAAAPQAGAGSAEP